MTTDTATAKDASVVALEWNGKEYELKYTFSIVRRMRAEGINLPMIFRHINKNPELAADYADEFAAIVAFLLREAGCPDVTAEKVWRAAVGNVEIVRNNYNLFYWVAGQHFAQSENVPTGKQ